MRVRIKNIKIDKQKNGQTYYYYRPTKERLPDNEDERIARVVLLNAQAVSERSAYHPGEINQCITHYRASPEFKQLAQTTKADYLRALQWIGDEIGRDRARDIDRPAVLALRDTKSDKPTTANAYLAVLRIVLGVAYDKGLVDRNHAVGIKKLKMGEGHRPWEEYEIKQFRSAFATDTWQRVAFELLLNTGQRSGDVRTMVRQHVSDGQISVRQDKTNARMWIPVSDDLRAVLDPWLAASSSEQLAIIVGERGRALGVSGFSGSRTGLKAAYRDAGLPEDVTGHGLRYTAATRIHELGLSWEDVASITGHQTMAMAKKYSQQKKRAGNVVAVLNKANAAK